MLICARSLSREMWWLRACVGLVSTNTMPETKAHHVVASLALKF